MERHTNSHCQITVMKKAFILIVPQKQEAQHALLGSAEGSVRRQGVRRKCGHDPSSWFPRERMDEVGETA